MTTPLVRWFVLLCSLMFLAACGDPLQAKIDNQIQFVDIQLVKLERKLDQGQIRNAKLIKEYGQILYQQKPELNTIINELSKDATSKGPLFQSLQSRYREAKQHPERFSTREERLFELENLYQAASVELFNDALSDPLNVLADLSEGQLARVNAIDKSSSLTANGAQDLGAGSQLIGNPAYGQWNTQSNGMSFWAWYGAFRLLDDVFDGRSKRSRVDYGHWSRHRDYSYHHDYGRYRYSSPKQIKKSHKVEKSTKDYFARQNKSFSSTYSKNRVGSSRVSSQSRSAQASAKKFNSQFSKSGSFKSTFSSNSSFRSYSGSSRGGSGGK